MVAGTAGCSGITYSDNPVARRYFAAVDYVDVNLQFRLTSQFEAYLNVNNLFDEPRKEITFTESRPRAFFWNGTRYNAGINARF